MHYYDNAQGYIPHLGADRLHLPPQPPPVFGGSALFAQPFDFQVSPSPMIVAGNSDWIRLHRDTLRPLNMSLSPLVSPETQFSGPSPVGSPLYSTPGGYFASAEMSRSDSDTSLASFSTLALGSPFEPAPAAFPRPAGMPITPDDTLALNVRPLFEHLPYTADAVEPNDQDDSKLLADELARYNRLMEGERQRYWGANHNRENTQERYNRAEGSGLGFGSTVNSMMDEVFALADQSAQVSDSSFEIAMNISRMSDMATPLVDNGPLTLPSAFDIAVHAPPAPHLYIRPPSPLNKAKKRERSESSSSEESNSNKGGSKAWIPQGPPPELRQDQLEPLSTRAIARRPPTLRHPRVSVPFEQTIPADQRPTHPNRGRAAKTVQDLGLVIREDGTAIPTPQQVAFAGTDRAGRPRKVFVCDTPGCSKVFNRNEHLLRHQRSTHTNQRPYPCPHPGCKKSFARSDNLSQHVNSVHSKDRPTKRVKTSHKSDKDEEDDDKMEGPSSGWYSSSSPPQWP